MLAFTNQPAVLLILTGGFLGLTFPFGKIATEAGIEPTVWAFVIASGAAIPLLLVQLLRKQDIVVNATYLRFYLVAAVISLVIPNLLIFIVIPHLGSGFTGLLFTLSPVFTLMITSLTRFEWPGRLGLAGIMVGFCGAVTVALTRGEIGQPASLAWIATGLGIPISLAIGNVYRSWAWPGNASAIGLAMGTNMVAAIILLAGILAHTGASSFAGLLDIPLLVSLQVVVAAALYACHARLQLVGGPLYLSQIGYIAAAIALLVGTLFLSERYSWVTWTGAIIILAGIACGVINQLSRNPAHKQAHNPAPQADSTTTP